MLASGKPILQKVAILLPVKHLEWILALVAPRRRRHRVDALLLAVERLVEAELMVAGNHDLVPVRLSGQPLVELPDYSLNNSDNNAV